MKYPSFPQRIFSLAAFSLIILVVAACGGSSSGSAPSSSNKVTITYLTHWSGPQIDQLNQAIASFNKSEPNITVKVQNVPFGNLLTTITTQGGSASGPTIMGIYNLWMPQLVQDGIIAAAPEANTNDIQKAYPQSTVSAVQVDGKTYGYPNEVDLYALNYNKALFQAAGISDPPKTWKELSEDAKKLTKRDSSGKITQQGFGIITSWNSGVVHPWLSLLNSNGGQLLSTDHKPQLNSKAAQETADLYHQLIFVDKTTDPAMGQANASTTGPYLDNFANGKTAMVIMANWWESNLKASMGDNFKNIATAPIPVGPSGDKAHSVSYSWSTVVNAHATPEQQTASWKFLQWLNGSQSGKNNSSAMGDILLNMGILPSRTSDLQAHQDQLTSPFIRTYVDQLQNSMPFPTVLGGDELTTSLQKSLEAMDFGQSSPQQGLTQAQTNLSQILSQYYS
ncbi:ABC transporter substrate-binding protein [Ktedonosporobacter rubrisoli]|uniref:ABC transporter substrate-binding protein n=1 Tax=Ktedonosporobacter rubrisoli TaxID=2509675 RepID=A0A4P6JVT2_KTERU|nr:ABC transporter substrate-binding protein [Ktedonosporobacter rubrisoli]QBD79086.1 ABC transporter substrate-binding protein [Ktedonosporobacter rubrisoli]